MAGISDLAQKAFYLGVGLASMAANKASSQIVELRKQAQKIADELVEQGEMTAEEARAFVDSLIKQGTEAGNAQASGDPAAASSTGPRNITIEDDDGNSTTDIELSEAGKLRQQVADLQAELEKLKSQ